MNALMRRRGMMRKGKNGLVGFVSGEYGYGGNLYTVTGGKHISGTFTDRWVDVVIPFDNPVFVPDGATVRAYFSPNPQGAFRIYTSFETTDGIVEFDRSQRMNAVWYSKTYETGFTATGMVFRKDNTANGTIEMDITIEINGVQIM